MTTSTDKLVEKLRAPILLGSALPRGDRDTLKAVVADSFEAAAKIEQLQSELAALGHDHERLMKRENEYLNRAERLQSVLDRAREALEASAGYLLNARLDLETGAPKATAIRTIKGGLLRIDAALAEIRGGE